MATEHGGAGPRLALPKPSCPIRRHSSPLTAVRICFWRFLGTLTWGCASSGRSTCRGGGEGEGRWSAR